jgi:3-oxoacyl-[acyl-carrier-protein] synthase III
MTTEERSERIEQNLADMAESQKEHQKRHDVAMASHASWLMDHERWMHDQEQIVERHEEWKKEMQLTLKALAASQALTDFKLQAFIDSLRRAATATS